MHLNKFKLKKVIKLKQSTTMPMFTIVDHSWSYNCTTCIINESFYTMYW